MLLSALKGSDPGIQISYRTDGGIFNTQRVKEQMKVQNHLFVTRCMLMTVLSLPTRRMTFEDLQILSVATKLRYKDTLKKSLHKCDTDEK